MHIFVQILKILQQISIIINVYSQIQNNFQTFSLSSNEFNENLFNSFINRIDGTFFLKIW